MITRKRPYRISFDRDELNILDYCLSKERHDKLTSKRAARLEARLRPYVQRATLDAANAARPRKDRPARKRSPR